MGKRSAVLATLTNKDIWGKCHIWFYDLQWTGCTSGL